MEGFDSELDVTVKIKVLGFENLESFEGFGGLRGWRMREDEEEQVRVGIIFPRRCFDVVVITVSYPTFETRAKIVFIMLVCFFLIYNKFGVR